MRLTDAWYYPFLILLLLTACGGSGKSNSSTPFYSPSTSPAAPAPASTTLTATPGDGQITLSWPAATGATSYNLYWSTSSGVTVSTGTKISAVTSPQIHGGLINGTGPYYYIVTAVNSGGESPASSQASASPVNGPTAADPLFPNQWHLSNASFSGEDIDVTPAWAACGAGNTCRGEGIRIAIVDDGLEILHEDLAANVATGLSYNYLNGRSDPTGGDHGTSVAGVAAARDLNGLGVRGAAPRANLVGYNVLSLATDTNIANAATRGSPDVHISNNSWGPTEGQGTLDASSSLWDTAIASGLTNGRGGKGTIYVWAGGNGANGSVGCGTCVDNSNYDGYANHHGIIAVCAVGTTGQAAYYSEPGANLLLCAPSSDSIGITTTDSTGSAGYNKVGGPDYPDLNYTNSFGGTSSSTPTVAGVVALMLQANPNLGWRDVRQILAQTARKNDPGNSGWINDNGAGFHVHHQYGFGVVDAAAAVTTASGWTNLGPELSYTSALTSPNSDIPDNNTTGVSSSISVPVSPNGINKIESVEVTFSASHGYSGDLQIILTSPAGIQSELAEQHSCAGSCTTYSGWIFSSVRDLNNTANGTWTLTVKDLASGDTGRFQSWKLKLYGRAS